MIALFIALVASTSAPALPLEWHSGTTGTTINGSRHRPAGTTQPTATVVYLTGLSIPRLGSESDDDIINAMTADGCHVIRYDYRRHPYAKSPELHLDLMKLRQELKVPTPDRLFIIPEGFRLKRDVEFARDGDRVLAMDVIYPSQPKSPVPVLMEITCDNVNRMGKGSLLFCRDTLLEGGALAGFAVAMVDHPVRPPYKGLDDPMPESLDRMKAAVAKLRELSKELGTSGKIGAIGFSRGGPFAAMLAGQGDVQAALIHGNRYDYLDLLDNDPMLARFEKAWGKREANADRWAVHGAARYLTEKASPMFLNTSDTESPEYRDGLEKFAALLKRRNVETVYQVDLDGRGHRVTTDPKTLARIYAFFHQHLK